MVLCQLPAILHDDNNNRCMKSVDFSMLTSARIYAAYGDFQAAKKYMNTSIYILYLFLYKNQEQVQNNMRSAVMQADVSMLLT